MGNPSSAVAVRKPRLLPLAAGGSFTDVSIYLMHCGLKSPCIISVLSQVLSCQKCMEAPRCTTVLTWGVEGLLATLSVRLCLLRALDCSTHTRTNANYYVFCFKEFFPYECGKCRIYSMNCFFFFFLCVCSRAFICSLICKYWAVAIFHCSFTVNSKLLV